MDYHKKLARLAKKAKKLELKRKIVREKMDSKNRQAWLREQHGEKR